jgi:hypothetical protein
MVVFELMADDIDTVGEAVGKISIATYTDEMRTPLTP